ncbi:MULTISPECIES: ABC transporter ATP-binding protein [Acidianus]|uniref:ABC transporter n=1 Tax=Candidatus Acidianus copahuensis TaxID=1160895 RepID=A0A031LNC5_9CREN|nr:MULTISPECIES: ABC transporter ATP-binding protein [Acidianus]EZQ04915.1 ABC transporter [Candidatus Acidianus copahuensis]NON61185.1 ABC transporter ATP-binding protein [Acidianus sp. RZ1]
MITATNLTKKYNDFEVLHSISFEITKGTITALIGPNGAGKSTLIKIMAGITKRSSGKIFVLGEDPWNNARLSKKVSLILEKPFIPSSVPVSELLESAISVFKTDKREIMYWLEDFNLLNFKDRKVGELSAGTRQKVQLVFALSKNPEIILADEPTANLDPPSRFSFYEMISKINRKLGTTVVISSHSTSELTLIATHVLVLYNGILRFSGMVNDFIRIGFSENFYIMVKDIEKSVKLLSEFSPEVVGNQIKVKGDLREIIRILMNNDVKVYFIRSSILDKSLQDVLGYELD